MQFNDYCNNYVYVYLEKWSNPSIIGQCIPPVSDFILEKINNTRAVLFGGGESNNIEEMYSNNIYLVEISVSTVVSLVC